jgi:hypothetical protein
MTTAGAIDRPLVTGIFRTVRGTSHAMRNHVSMFTAPGQRSGPLCFLELEAPTSTIFLPDRSSRASWNKAKLIGQKPLLKARKVWSVRVRLLTSGHKRDLAPFNLAIDSAQRGCDLARSRIIDLWIGDEVRSRAEVV